MEVERKGGIRGAALLVLAGHRGESGDKGKKRIPLGLVAHAFGVWVGCPQVFRQALHTWGCGPC